MVDDVDANWFENEVFWQDYYPYMFDEKRMASASDEVDQVIALAGYRGHNVLDLCCGPGRHCVIFSQLGYRITAVDRSVFLLSKAAERASQENAEVEFVQMDMRDFVRPDAYNLAVNLFTSFGYFEKKEDDIKVLSNLYQSLKQNGALLIDVVAKEILARNIETTRSNQDADGTLFVERHDIVDDWSRVRNEWIIIKNGTVKSYKFEHNIYSGQELKERLLAAGFATVKLFGNLAGDPFDLNAGRLVALAVKD